MLGKDFTPIKCVECKRTVIKLVPLNDDGTGKKLCSDCKKQIKGDLK